MSVKEELIATALTAADELDRVYENAPVEQNSNDLREACARAMVQPDIGEVKNLVSAACNLMFDAGKLLGRRDAGADREVEDARSARTALLDYVRAIMAERDALIADKRAAPQPGGDSTSSFPDRDLTKPAGQQGLFYKFDVRRVDGSSLPGGKHHGCEYFVLDLNHDDHAPAALRGYALSCSASHPQLSADLLARYPTVSTAEVPMPQGYAERPSDYTGSIWIESQMRQYGDLREAAGYARGLAAGGKDAERYRWLRAYKIKHNGHCMALTGPILWEENLDDAIDAALRGEVKP